RRIILTPRLNRSISSRSAAPSPARIRSASDGELCSEAPCLFTDSSRLPSIFAGGLALQEPEAMKGQSPRCDSEAEPLTGSSSLKRNRSMANPLLQRSCRRQDLDCLVFYE